MEFVPPMVQILQITPGAAAIIEQAAKTCTNQPVKPDYRPDLFERLMRRGHFSVFEHAMASFDIRTDRAVSHEIVRHRLASYSQQSQRYVDTGRYGVTYIWPNMEDGIPYEVRRVGEEAEHAYQNLRQQGIPPEKARCVLPNMTATRIVMSANFREWMHVLYLRTSPHAHPDIQRIMLAVKHRLSVECPEIFDTYDRLLREGIVG